MTEVNLTLGAELQRLKLEPGDRLLLRVDAEISVQQTHEIRQFVQAQWGADIPLLVVGRCVTVEVVNAEPTAQRGIDGPARGI